jgi:hypothetical protein
MCYCSSQLPDSTDASCLRVVLLIAVALTRHVYCTSRVVLLTLLLLLLLLALHTALTEATAEAHEEASTTAITTT